MAVALNLQTAFDLVYTVNKAAKIRLLCLNAGVAPKGLGRAEMRKLVKFWKLEE